MVWILIPSVILLFFGWGLVWDFLPSSTYWTPKSYPTGVVIIFMGLALLAAVYVLDRFYYYKLLVGAVHRCRELELQHEFQLTSRISQSVSQHHATRLITWFYFLPGFITMIGAFAIMRWLEFK